MGAVAGSAARKHVNVKVPDDNERAILRKVVELRAAGQSLDQIRQHLSYVMKVRTRMGGEWTTGRITFLFQQGLRLLADLKRDKSHFARIGRRTTSRDLDQGARKR